MNKHTRVEEGVYDKGAFKAVFLAGGGGSGKGFVGQKMFGGENPTQTNTDGKLGYKSRLTGPSGLKVVNTDDLLELLMTKHGKSVKTDIGDKLVQKPGGLRHQAKVLGKSLLRQTLRARNGVVIDGTGSDPKKIVKLKKMMERFGYDTHMVFVDTPLETALKNNETRARKVPPAIVKQDWESAQALKGKYEEMFGADSFYHHRSEKMYTQDEARRELVPKLSKITDRFVNAPVRNEKGRTWLKKTAGKTAHLVPGLRSKTSNKKPAGKPTGPGRWVTANGRHLFIPEGIARIDTLSPLTEATLARLMQQTNSDDGFAIVSADKSGRSKDENRAQRKEMEKHLRSKGWGFTRVEGRYTSPKDGKHSEAKEQSHFITKIDKEQAKALSKHLHDKFQQECILWGNDADGIHLVFGKDQTIQKIGTKMNLVGVTDAYSKWKRHRLQAGDTKGPGRWVTVKGRKMFIPQASESVSLYVRRRPLEEKKMDHTAYPLSLRSKSMAELQYIVKDAQQAMQANPDSDNNSYYADEVNYASMEMARRRKLAKRSSVQEGKQTSYDDLTLIPSMTASAALEHPHTQYRSHEVEPLRKNMTPEQRAEFIKLADKRCRDAYKVKAPWFMKATRSDNGPQQLMTYMQHWLGSYLLEPEQFKRNMGTSPTAEPKASKTKATSAKSKGAGHWVTSRGRKLFIPDKG